MTRSQRNAPSSTLIIAGIALLVVAIVATGGLLLAGGGDEAAATEGSTSRLLTPQQYVDQFADSPDHILIDVRTAQEFDGGHIPGAINIPVNEVGSRLAEISADQTVVVYCRTGNRSAQAADTLEANGYTVYDLGGIVDWQAAGLPVE